MWSAAAFNLMNLERPDGYEVRFIQGRGWCPAARHNNALARAQIWGADVACFMGPDHWVAKDTLVRLLAHIKSGKWDMAAGWVPSRGVCGKDKVPFDHLAYKLREDAPLKAQNPLRDFDDDDFEIIKYGSKSQQVHVIGTGILMFDMDAIIGMKLPWFREFVINDGGFGRIPIQDTYFAFRCTVQHGARLWLDTTIEAYHLDVFAIDETFSDRFDDFQGDANWTPMERLGDRQDGIRT